MSQIDMSQYKKDARGNLVPIANIRPIDLLRDELVQKITARARAVQEELQEYRRWAMDEIAAFAELSANQYGTSLGGKKGNIRLHSFDGQYRVQLAMQDALVFDEGLAAAKVLIDECIREYSEGSRPELLAIINAAFVLGLRRLDIGDEKWQRAMDALSDSLQVHTSKAFVRVHERDANGEYRLMNLDIAKV